MTKQVKIYHNPRCSKSRETLNLLKENGVEPEVVLYLETPADAATLRDLLKILGMNSARELMRQKEDLYKELNLADSSLSEELSLIHISEPTRLGMISYAVFCLKKKIVRGIPIKKKTNTHHRANKTKANT